MNEIVKDSGSVQEFSTGAHRDQPKGKGRCDLLPLLEVASVMRDDVLQEIGDFMNTRDTDYLINAIRKSTKTVQVFRYQEIRKELLENDIECKDFSNESEDYDAMFTACLSHMMLEVSKLYEAGAEKYQPNNWQLGMPVNRYIDSGVRHYLKTLRGDVDEPHYRGFIWNLLCAVWTAKNLPEMNFKEEPKKPE